MSMFASQKVRNERLAVCATCAQKVGTPARCALCHCALIIKTLGREASCPAGKW